MKILNSIKKDEIINAVTRTASKYGYRLKKASPTIMIVGAAVCGVAATVMACKATVRAQDILEEHKADVATIHKAKEQIENGQIILNKDEAYTEEDVKKDITAVYIQTGVKLAKAYAPAVSLGVLAIGCMFGSHHIMSKRNATLTAAYIALDKTFNEYKSRVTERFGDRIQHELEHNIKAVEVESTAKKDDGTEEVIKEYKDIASKHESVYTCVFDSTVDTWEPDIDLNRNYLFMVEKAANKRLKSQGHLFLNDVLSMIGTYGGNGTMKVPVGQLIGWIYDPNDLSKQNCISFGIDEYIEGVSDIQNIDTNPFAYNMALLLTFNCDGVIIDKI